MSLVESHYFPLFSGYVFLFFFVIPQASLKIMFHYYGTAIFYPGGGVLWIIRKKCHRADMKINITINTANISKVAMMFSTHIGRVHCRVQPFSAPYPPRGFGRNLVETNNYWACHFRQIISVRKYPWRKTNGHSRCNLGASHQQEKPTYAHYWRISPMKGAYWWNLFWCLSLRWQTSRSCFWRVSYGASEGRNEDAQYCRARL